MVLLAGQGIPETINLPGALGSIPTQFPILEMVGNVDHIGRGRKSLRRCGCGLRRHVGSRGETGFVLEPVHPAIGEELQLGNDRTGGSGRGAAAHAEEAAAHRPGIRDPDTEEPGSGFGDAERHFGNTSATDIADLGESDSVIAAFQHGGRRTAAESASTGPDHGQGMDGNRLGESILDPGKACFVISREKDSVGDISVGKLFQREVSAAGSHDGAERSCAPAPFRLPNGNHSDVLVEIQFRPAAPAGRRPVLERAGMRKGFREYRVDGTAPLHRPPDQTLHRILGSDPGTAGGTPPGGGGDGEFETQGIGGPDRVLEGILPALVHIDEPFVHNRGRSQRGVEIMHTAQADAVHPLQVLLQAVLGDVPVHPMPPHAGAGGLGRIRPALFQLGGRGREAPGPDSRLGPAGRRQQSGEKEGQCARFHLLYTSFLVSGSRL